MNSDNVISSVPKGVLTPLNIDANDNCSKLFMHFFGNANCFDLLNFIKASRGVIAGSAALWLANPYCDANKFSGDIDIWIQDSDCLERTRSGNFNTDYRTYRSACYESHNHMLAESYAKLVMSTLGYVRTLASGRFREVEHEYDTNVDQNFKFINAIHTFALRSANSFDKRKVQIIYTSIPPIEMVKRFDLSVCQTFYTGDQELFSYFPEHVLRKMFYNFSPESRNCEVREKKYINRGFKKM
jgi:hypothetical protein